MAVETLGLPDPVATNVNDGAQIYDLAVGFSTLSDGQGLGVEWFTPLSAPGITPVVKWWRVSDGALLASKSFTAVAGTRQQIFFDDPIDVPAGSYRVSVETIFFTLTSDWAGWPASSSGMVTANPDGWLHVEPGFPDNGVRTALYHVSPIWEAAGVAPAEGSVAVGLDLSLATSGATDHEGAAALGLNLATDVSGAAAHDGSASLGLNFALALTGHAPVIGPAQGAIASHLVLAPAAAGARDSRGTASVSLNLAPAVAGRRDSAGATALGLVLATAAAGSDGSLARPRGPWLTSRRGSTRDVSRDGSGRIVTRVQVTD